MEDLSVIQTLLSLLFSQEISTNFRIKEVQDYSEHIEIHLEELAELVPEALFDCEEIALDGFYNPKELQSFPIKGKAVYLKLYRRRWKVKGTTKHYSNSYNLNQEGVKATKEFSSFLKDTFRQTSSEYNRNRNSFMH